MKNLFKSLIVLVVILLSGCVDTIYDIGNADFNDGRAKFDHQDYAGSLTSFTRCANKGNPNCMFGVGAADKALGYPEVAKSWFTLAARYGLKPAQDTLTENGWPVPAADLANQSGNIGALDLTNSFLKGYNQGTQSQTNCTSTVIGSQVFTNCN
ncbi:MAG TPA: hypothetical protein VMV70_00515 [Gallionella sp.]|nr:hypothetical protein [Gallionella sp.]